MSFSFDIIRFCFDFICVKNNLINLLITVKKKFKKNYSLLKIACESGIMLSCYQIMDSIFLFTVFFN